MYKTWKKTRAERLLAAEKITIEEFDRRLLSLRASQLGEREGIVLGCFIGLLLATPMRYYDALDDARNACGRDHSERVCTCMVSAAKENTSILVGFPLGVGRLFLSDDVPPSGLVALQCAARYKVTPV